MGGREVEEWRKGENRGGVGRDGMREGGGGRLRERGREREKERQSDDMG